VIILGAARSGTKLLRGLVAASGCYAEIPFDVNYIWRYGNERCPHDVLTPDMLRESVRRFVRARLARIAVQQTSAFSSLTRRNSTGGDPLPFVEKTVSNVLRAPYVKAIYPEAKYIAIIRDGRDVAESAARCWSEPPAAGYLLTKLRTFPWLRCAPYGAKYALNVARRTLRLDRHLRTWGPRYPGIDDHVRRLSLLEVCARQWAHSIELYERARPTFAARQLFQLRYEELVKDTESAVRGLCRFLSIDDVRPVLEYARRTIQADRLGTRRRLSPGELEQVLEISRPTLERWGYLEDATHRRVA
jgi:hypothetical protein